MKILVDLCDRDGITMIMVTHDVGLKNYSHKVVRMADGKVANIKETDPKARKEIIS